MSKVFTQDGSNVRWVKITDEIREAYANRDKSLDSTVTVIVAGPV
jgi:hypothetical protein